MFSRKAACHCTPLPACVRASACAPLRQPYIQFTQQEFTQMIQSLGQDIRGPRFAVGGNATPTQTRANPRIYRSFLHELFLCVFSCILFLLKEPGGPLARRAGRRRAARRRRPWCARGRRSAGAYGLDTFGKGQMGSALTRSLRVSSFLTEGPFGYSR